MFDLCASLLGKTHLLSIVPDHDLQISGKLSVQQCYSRLCGRKVPVDRRPIDELSIDRSSDLQRVCSNHLLARELSRFCQRGNIRKGQKVLESLLLLLVRDERQPTGALWKCLGKGYGTVIATVRRNLMHHAAAASGFAEYRDARRIAAEKMNVLLNPLESKTLVVQACIRCAVFLESWTGEPAHGS